MYIYIQSLLPTAPRPVPVLLFQLHVFFFNPLILISAPGMYLGVGPSTGAWLTPQEPHL